MPARCPVCGKLVYAAEERVAGGHHYHSVCFKCSLCNTLLDSTKVAEHGAELFCKKCHVRRYGPKGVGFGLGAGTLSADRGERFGNTVDEMGGPPQMAAAFTAPINPSIQ